MIALQQKKIYLSNQIWISGYHFMMLWIGYQNLDFFHKIWKTYLELYMELGMKYLKIVNAILQTLHGWLCIQLTLCPALDNPTRWFCFSIPNVIWNNGFQFCVWHTTREVQYLMQASVTSSSKRFPHVKVKFPTNGSFQLNLIYWLIWLSATSVTRMSEFSSLCSRYLGSGPMIWYVHYLLVQCRWHNTTVWNTRLRKIPALY